MAQVDELIQKIMADPKFAASSNFAGRIYHDEPILFPARQMARYTPPRIMEMRRIARKTLTEAELFVEQGMFMESFEDDFAYRGEFVQYFPTYQAMSDAQLRGYFSWRTKVRRGSLEKTSLSFVFVYLYELLNGIGVGSPEEGYHALRAFWTSYREVEPRITSYVATWLKDYVIYHDLPLEFLEGLPDLALDEAVAVLLDHRRHGDDAVFSALNSLSAYDLVASRFFRQYPEDVKRVVCRVFGVVSDYYNRNPRNSAREKLFGRMCANPYHMFRSAVFHHRHRGGDRLYEVGSHHRYICENGTWRCERFVWYGRNNKRIGALLKTVDHMMREAYGFKSTLLPGKINKILKAKIAREIAKDRQARLANVVPEIAIDVSKLHAIRANALATQNRLLVEEPEPDDPPPALVRPAPAQEDAPVAGLDEVERRFLRAMIGGEPYQEILRANGCLLSVLVDGINEKLFSVFNDTVIEHVDGSPRLIEDYVDDLKGLLG